MENLLLELQGKLEKANKKVLSLEKNANAEKTKTNYYKKQLLQLTSELTKANNNLKYYGNLSVELQEEVNNIDKNCICTFNNDKYTDEIYSVCILRNVAGQCQCCKIWITFKNCFTKNG